MMIPRIVIVGGGAGGLELATRLGNKLGKRDKANITLIDANPTHLWKPRLHEVAAGVLNPNIDELNYAAHGHMHHFHFALGKMQNLDREQRSVELAPVLDGEHEVLPARSVSYDYLVLALGSQTNDFSTPGADKHCLFLDQRAAAESLRQRLINAYLEAGNSPEPNTLNLVIVGAGATGVELAAELHHTTRELNRYGFNGIPHEHVNITIVEAADRVMPALREKSSAAIYQQLRQMNIHVHLSERVMEVTEKGLHTQSGSFLPADIQVWSAGVKGPEFLSNLKGIETNRIHQVKVNAYLQTPNDERIFALGDCAECIPEGEERPVPPRAQSASQQASLLAKSLSGIVQGKSPLLFIYRDKGSLISLSKHSSVGQIMGNLSGNFTFEGKLARLFYITLYRLHQQVLHGWFKTLLLIVRDRINQKTGPTMKLH